MSHRMTPLGALGRGLVAGALGTALMTGWQTLSARLQSSEEEPESSGSEEPRDPWEEASAPAKVGRRIIEGVFGRTVPPERIPLLTNVMHWSYGTGWGAVYGLVAGSRRGRALTQGAAFGTAVWAMSYAQLVPMGLYAPPWTYSPKQLAMDLSYHLVYGVGVGGGYAALDPR